MTSKKRMLKRTRNFKLAGYVLLVGAFLIVIIKAPSDEQFFGLFLPSIACALIGCSLLFYASSLEKKWWNNLSLNERCEELAYELSTGKRDWYLNSFVNTKYFFAPLCKNDMNEQGVGRHIATTKDEVLRLIKEEQIENVQMAKLTISHFESIL